MFILQKWENHLRLVSGVSCATDGGSVEKFLTDETNAPWKPEIRSNGELMK